MSESLNDQASLTTLTRARGSGSRERGSKEQGVVELLHPSNATFRNARDGFVGWMVRNLQEAS